jgi:hypothetical protein
MCTLLEKGVEKGGEEIRGRTRKARKGKEGEEE